MRNFLLWCIGLFFVISCKSNVKDKLTVMDQFYIEDDAILKISDIQSDLPIFKTSNKIKLSSNKIVSTPIIAKSVIYVLDNKNYIMAYSAKDKHKIWQYKISGNYIDPFCIRGELTYNNGKLYVNNGSRYMIIIDAKTGDEIIRIEFPDIIFHKIIVLDKDSVLVQTVNNQILVYDLLNMKEKWSYRDSYITNLFTKNIVAPVVKNGYIMASTTSGKILYLDQNNGEVKWIYHINKLLDDNAIFDYIPKVLVVEPILYGGYAYLATSTHHVLKIDLITGKAIWEKKISAISAMCLCENTIFLLLDNEKKLLALNSDTGKITWIGKLTTKNDDAQLLKPFIGKDVNGDISVNILSSSGKLYKFFYDKNHGLKTVPHVSIIPKKINRYIKSCCSSEFYLFTDQDLLFQ
ncbi:outer membrane protein assembly factor BamB family protein [Rickettsia endosymbiont of Cardiosporidium cionae]|uniref:outer membrane protein assembly factor BamB family protein n=1 Tax=Rickettsia endosymbiont of Cardiosporidium cionae TaxID=2777155 RepID=UPI00189370FA|nr:PQQ-binding-like beta-propeller repeat protein [Rickettsia endosymbiont of Cardiosporidium cionae]